MSCPNQGQGKEDISVPLMETTHCAGLAQVVFGQLVWHIEAKSIVKERSNERINYTRHLENGKVFFNKNRVECWQPHW